MTQTDFRAARRLALKIVLGQLGISLLAAGLFQVVSGYSAALSALIGGGIGAVGSLTMALSAFRGGESATPEDLMRGVYLGEFVKLILTVALFIAAIVWLGVDILPLLIGFAATFVVYWAALLRAMPSITGHSG